MVYINASAYPTPECISGHPLSAPETQLCAMCHELNVCATNSMYVHATFYSKRTSSILYRTCSLTNVPRTECMCHQLYAALHGVYRALHGVYRALHGVYRAVHMFSRTEVVARSEGQTSSSHMIHPRNTWETPRGTRYIYIYVHMYTYICIYVCMYIYIYHISQRVSKDFLGVSMVFPTGTHVPAL